MQVATEHAEAECQRPGAGVEKGLFLHRVALHAAHIAERDQKLPRPIEANLANTQGAIGNRAAMPASEAPHLVPAQLFVELAFECQTLQSLSQRSHDDDLSRSYVSR